MDEDISKLLKELIPWLKIDVPIMSARIKGNSLELFLYGGEKKVLTLPPKEEQEKPAAARTAPKKSSRKKSCSGPIKLDTF